MGNCSLLIPNYSGFCFVLSKNKRIFAHSKAPLSGGASGGSRCTKVAARFFSFLTIQIILNTTDYHAYHLHDQGRL